MSQLATSPLTEMQRAFVHHVLAGLSHVKAAELAGYSSPQQSAYLAARSPAVRRAITDGLATQLATEGAPAAYRLLVRVVNDETISARTRIDAGKALLDRAGFVPPKAASAPEGLEKAVSEMSREELRQFVDQAERRLAEQAVDVSPPAEVEGDDA